MSNSIRVLGSNPDRIVFTDKSLIALLGSSINEPVAAISPRYWIAANRLHTIRRELKSWGEHVPDWVDNVMDDSYWASGKLWNDERVAWLLGKNRMIVQAPYSLTLADAIGDLDSPYFYSSMMKGWVVKVADHDIDAINSMLIEYDIESSGTLKDYLDGRSSWRSTLLDIIKEAQDLGFKAIEKFKSGRTYKWWQKEAVIGLAFNGGGLLADQVGLGKGGSFTGGHLSLEKWLKKNKKGTGLPVIFSVTKTMKREIAEEIWKWKEDAQIQILEGTKRDPLVPGMDFYILNHDILDPRLPDILEVEPKGFVADESHVFKNPDAKRTQAAAALAEAVRENTEYPYIVMASGTPFLSSPIELWSILGILGVQQMFSDYALKKLGTTVSKVYFRDRRGKMRSREQTIGPRRAFEMYFCDGHYDKYRAWHSNGSSHTIELNRLLISSGMIRRRKSDVMHPLPELKERIVKIQPSIEEMEVYAEKEDEFRAWALDQAHILAEEEGIELHEASRIIARKLYKGEHVMRLTELRKTLAFAKIEGTVEWIHRFMAGDPEIIGDDADRKKLIVFVHHQEPRRQLVNHPDLQQYGITTILAGSEQNGDSVQSEKELFQIDPKFRLMICTMAAREGHTLTAAKDVYLMEIPFVPSWIVQMAGRCWARLSEQYEPHDATVHYAIVPGTEDMRSIQRVRIKKAIFSAVIDAEGQDDTIDDIREESLAEMIEALISGDKELTIAR